MSSDVSGLPPAIQRLYNVVKDGKRTHISTMYVAVSLDTSTKLSTREMQQHIGWAVTNLNRRIRKPLKKILKPAEVKGTYALVSL